MNSAFDQRRLSIRSVPRRDVVLMAMGLCVVAGSLLADSVINGQNGGNSVQLADAVQRLQNVPAEFGNWTSVDGDISQREQSVAGIHGYIRRTYTNQRSGYEVHLTVLCGPSGPIAVHPPTACFEGIGYELTSGPTPVWIRSDDRSDKWQFNKSSFRQNGVTVPEIVRVFWAWSLDGKWEAPESPRMQFRGQPWLYKIYVTDSRYGHSDDSALPQIEAFMKDALPRIQRALQPANTDVTANTP